MDKAKLNKALVAVDANCGYLLFFLMGLYFLSGYGRTKSILDAYTMKVLHEVWLPIPTFAAFLLHSLLNVRFILIGRGVRDRLWWNFYLILLGIIMLVSFLYIQLR